MNNEEASRNGNTKPGTVVDKGVTDVFRFDYYLQAHNGLQVGGIIARCAPDLPTS